MKFTDLLFSRVVNKDGRKLGHLIDVRGQPLAGEKQGSGAVLTELLYGTGGLLERLGLREVETQAIPWESVVKIERKKITIANLHQRKDR